MRSSGGAPISIPRSLWLATLGVLLLAAFAVGAQDTPAPPATPAAAPNGPVLLVVVDVKPDMWDDYVALQKSDAIPALQKGVIDHRSAWRTAALGPAYSVAYLYQLTSFGVLDGDPPMRRALGADGEKAYNVKLRHMLVGSRTCALRRRPDLGFGSETSEPKLGVLAHVFTIPGKQAEYESVLKSDWIPGLKKAGVPLYVVYEVVMGGEQGEYYTFTPIANLAALDGGHPIQRGLGEQGMAALEARFASSIRSIERTVIRRDDDLSFTTKKPPVSQ